jgi:anti-sigma B factor antagonist
LDADDRTYVFRAVGQLTGDTARDIKEELKQVIGDGFDVLIELSGVTFTDSEGLGALVSVYRKACLTGRRFLLCSPRSNFMALLRLTRLQRVFEVVADLETAKEMVRQEVG